MHHTPKPARRAGRLAILGAASAAAVALAVAGTTPFAQAATVTFNPLDPALGFNSFVEDETVLASTEAEGPIATGGNLLIEGSYNVMIHTGTGAFTAPGDAQPSALVVGGRVVYTVDPATSVVQVLNSGYVKVGDLTGTDVLNTDQNNASVNTELVAAGSGYNSTPRIQLTVQQPIDSVGPSSPIDFDAAFGELRANADTLVECQANVTMRDGSGNAVAKGAVTQGQNIHVTLEAGVTNVLDVTGEDLNNMGDIVFDGPLPSADTPLLINVDTSGTGGELDWVVAPQSPVSIDQAPYMLWNFGTSTTRLRIAGGDTVEGSILAPNADYSDVSPTNVEGQIVAKNASLGEIGENGGEIHHAPFAAELTCETDVQPTDGPSTPGGGTTAPGDTTAPGTTGPGGGSLATTGDSLRPLIIAAGALVAVGAAVLVATGLRRKGARG
ncbi:choice-of-anchor A family protein [Glycomyces paridis]|uniref:Choice-of-anchor A family protein n=1 Tax=Glycomyces paridis TaxID=2126555 RepID=A0A4S8PKG1_9ACTN|nr:choice-of-anchor A family protein [Glycomyces paridis]THV30185.1 choice-of-anchor A family protein [Glycomyces paridis]